MVLQDGRRTPDVGPTSSIRSEYAIVDYHLKVRSSWGMDIINETEGFPPEVGTLH